MTYKNLPFLTKPMTRDALINPFALPSLGANSPQHKIIANDGSVGTAGNSIGFDGSTQYATLADNAELDAIDDASFSFWLKPEGNFGTFLFRDGYIQVRQNYSDLVIKIGTAYEVYYQNVLIDGAHQHFVITIENTGSLSVLKLYVDGVLNSSDNVLGAALIAQTTPFLFGTDGGTDLANCWLDECQMYNVVLSQTDVTELWNSGDGTTGVPTAVTMVTDLVFRFHFDNGTVTSNDSALGTGHDLVLTGTPTEESPMITTAGTAGSFGVASLAWPAGQTSQLFFTKQFNHDIEEGSDIKLHIHYSQATGNSGDMVWGLEYIWVSLNNTFANTTVVETTITVDTTANKHCVADIATIDGTGQKVSSILTGRLYRKGTGTFPDDIFVDETDFHISINSPGSRAEWVK